MAARTLPATMRAWQYTTASPGGLVPNLHLNTVPVPHPKPTQHLMQVLAAAINPVDYKPAEIALLSRLVNPKPATPGFDFAGRLITPAAASDLKPGQLIFGMSSTSPLAGGGALREYAVVDPSATVASLAPYVQPGDKVFINGGSGGTGIFAIQIAKALGCHVTASCSAPNMPLCTRLGADEVIDYTAQPLTTLVARGPVFAHVVDNVGGDFNLYWQCHRYTTPHAKFIYVGASPSLAHIANMFKVTLLPGFLGGGKRKFVGLLAVPSKEELTKIAAWMVEGKVEAVVDETFAFEKVPEAFTRLKTGRARGKIVVEVAAV
ncbi:hypothetical protein LTR08_003524 [Meristemomyces frigidus]|nr:hypothetical protein LTR08_003524 [Meristemomyces frigidus]